MPKEVEVLKKEYKCDICGKTYKIFNDADRCEHKCKQKTCKHFKYKYTGYYSGGGLFTINKECSDCKFIIEQVPMLSIEILLEEVKANGQDFLERCLEKYK